MQRRFLALALVVALLAGAHAARPAAEGHHDVQKSGKDKGGGGGGADDGLKFTAPQGLFIQERASKQLPGPGQHFSFGALKCVRSARAAAPRAPRPARSCASTHLRAALHPPDVIGKTPIHPQTST